MFIKSTSAAITAVALIAIVFLLATPRASAQPTGKEDFNKNCAGCHGSDAKGNGPVLNTIPGLHPADLTQLSARNGGKFPTDQVRDAIDGRKKIPSHERLNMPFWGVTMQTEGKEFTPQSEASVKKRINSIVGYIESIQQK